MFQATSVSPKRVWQQDWLNFRSHWSLSCLSWHGGGWVCGAEIVKESFNCCAIVSRANKYNGRESHHQFWALPVALFSTGDRRKPDPAFVIWLKITWEFTVRMSVGIECEKKTCSVQVCSCVEQAERGTALKFCFCTCGKSDQTFFPHSRFWYERCRTEEVQAGKVVVCYRAGFAEGWSVQSLFTDAISHGRILALCRSSVEGPTVWLCSVK